MLYAIIATDVVNSLEKRLSVRPAHVERLKQLQAEGRIVLAGPHPAVDSNDPGDAGFTGSRVAGRPRGASAACRGSVGAGRRAVGDAVAVHGMGRA